MIQLLTEMLQVNPDDKLTETSIWLMGNLFNYEHAKDYIEAETLKTALPFIIKFTDHPVAKIRNDAFYVCEKIYYLDSDRLRDIKLEMIDYENWRLIKNMLSSLKCGENFEQLCALRILGCLTYEDDSIINHLISEGIIDICLKLMNSPIKIM